MTTSPPKTDRSRRPVPGPTPPLRLPTAQRMTLSGGLEVLLIAHRKAPVANFTLVLPRGSAADPHGQAGLAGLAASMLDEGTARHSSLELSDELDYLGAYVGTGSGWDATFVTLTTLTRHLERATELYAEVITAPALAEAEWTRIRKQRLDGLSAATDQPATLAAWTFDATLYSTSHPYGYPSGGTPATVGDIGLDSVRRHYREVFRPAGATLIVVGDVTAAEILPLMEKRFAGWSGSVRPIDPPAGPPRAPGVRITVVDKPGASQSVLRIGHVGLAREHPDYFPVRVMNTVLGGYFASRINRNLREQKGYTYGAGSSFDFRRRPGPFSVHGGVHTKDTAAAVGEVIRELRDIRGPRAPSAEETASAVNFMTRGFVRHFETARQIGDNWSALVMHRLPDDFFNTWVETVNGVDRDAVCRAAAEHLRPDDLDIVLAGDASAVVKPLESLDVGPVRVIGKDGIFGPAPGAGAAQSGQAGRD